MQIQVYFIFIFIFLFLRAFLKIFSLQKIMSKENIYMTGKWKQSRNLYENSSVKNLSTELLAYILLSGGGNKKSQFAEARFLRSQNYKNKSKIEKLTG